MVSKSGLAPKGISTPEAICVAIQMGLEVGLPPLASLQNIAVINGRPALWGDAVLGVCRATGDVEEFDEWFEQGGQRLPRNPTKYTDDTVAVCRVRRRGDKQAKEVGFSVLDAKRADLWDERQKVERWKDGKKIKVSEGKVSQAMMDEWVNRAGVVLRGAGVDESPHAYKRLADVLQAQGDTVRILNILTPIGVAMAGEDVYDPYKD